MRDPAERGAAGGGRELPYLDRIQASYAGGGGGAAVQHKKGGAPKTGNEDEPELARNGSAAWPVFAQTGLPYLVAPRSGRPGMWVVRDWIAAAADLTHVGGVMRAPSRARELLTAMGWVSSASMEFAASSLNFTFHGGINHFELSAEAAWATGLPKGRPAIVDRDGKQGLIVTLSLDDASVPPGRPHAMTTSETERALQAAAGFTGLTIDPAGHTFLMSRWVRPQLQTGNGVLTIELNRALCRTLFTPDAYDEWLGGKRARAAESKTPKLKLENFYQRPIPGQLTHYGDLVEAGEALRMEVLVDWPHHYPDPEVYDAPPMVTPSKFANIALLECAWRFERLDGAVDGPAARGAIETQSTTVSEAMHRFRLAPGEASGTFRVTCDARFDAYFEPATFTREIVVMSSQAAMSKLKTEAFAGLGSPDTDRRKDQWTGDVRPGFKPTPAIGTAGDLEDPMARDRAAQRGRLHDVAEYLRGSAASAEAVAALDREKARQERSEQLIAADRDKGWQPFQLRGTYLSRTEGLASGPLDLHGTVRVERHVDSYAGDGPSTTMHVRNDKFVVQLRDLSRRFEQSDFAFEGKADTFDDALRHAFEDLAVAYPKGLVSIEAEQVRGSALRTADGAPGPGAGLGVGTGKVIGFQRSTETAWKKVKEVVWDPVASVVVNLGAIALMTLVPGSAAVVAPALIAYNSAPSIDRLKTESDRGTLAVGTFAMSTGEIARNLLPLVSRAKPFTAGWFVVETANWGGQTALMGAAAVDMARRLQATQVAALAQEYQQLLELQKTSLPSDPGLAIAEDRIRRKAAALDDEISRQFWEQVKGNFFQMAAGSVIHNSASHVRTAVLEHLGARPGAGATAQPGDASAMGPTGDAPPAPPHGAAPHPLTHDGGDPPSADRTGPPAQPAAHPPSPSGGQLAAEAATDKRLRQDGAELRADAADLHWVQSTWPGRSKGHTVTPIHYDPDTSTAHFDVLHGSERLRVTSAVAPRITTAAELTSTTNRVVGRPVSASDGLHILRALNEHRLDALSAVGVSVPEGTQLKLGTEFGLGGLADGKVVVVLGERQAVDWAYLPGLKPKAHTHPSTPGNDLLKYTGSESVPLTRILESTKDPLIARELVLPSPPDIAVMARLGVDGHRVVTPFVVHHGNVMKPKPGDNAPRLEWVIEQPREVGRAPDGSTVYEAVLVGEVGGKPVVQTRIWSIEPPNPTPLNPGIHLMTAPALTPTVKPATAGPKKTPVGGPAPTDPIARLTTKADA